MIENKTKFEKTVFRGVTVEELHKGKKQTYFTIYHIPVPARTEKGEPVTLRADLAFDNKYSHTMTFERKGFNIEGDQLFAMLLDHTERNSRGYYPTASMSTNDDKFTYTYATSRHGERVLHRVIYDPAEATLTFEDEAPKIATDPLAKYFTNATLAESKYLKAIRAIVWDYEGDAGLKAMAEPGYNLTIRKDWLDAKVLQIDSKPVNDKWGTVHYTLTTYEVEEHTKAVKDLYGVELTATGLPIAIIKPAQQNPYESTTKVMTRQTENGLHIDMDGVLEAFAVLKDREHGLDIFLLSRAEKIIRYLKKNGHTATNPVPLGRIADDLRMSVIDTQRGLEALNREGKADCKAAQKARDDQVFYTEAKQ